MNEMNNNMHLQNLMNMKLQLSNMESQFNLLLTQIQNMGLTPETSNQIINIPFQFINFGIQMLRTVTQINNFNININNIVIKEQINNAINNLNNISITISTNRNNINNEINIMPFPGTNDKIKQCNPIKIYNITFINNNNGNLTVINCEPYKTVDEMIKMFLVKIGRNELIDNEEKVFNFIYNASAFNTYENKVKSLFDVFKHSISPRIKYFER